MMVKYVHIFHKFVGLEHRRQCWYSVWIHRLWSTQHRIILFLSKLNVSERTCVVRQLMVRHEGKLLKPICVEHGVSTLVAHQGPSAGGFPGTAQEISLSRCPLRVSSFICTNLRWDPSALCWWLWGLSDPCHHAHFVSQPGSPLPH